MQEVKSEKKITVSTDKSKLDLELINSFLPISYWAKERPIEVIKKSIDNSLCFGLYEDDKQIGFARVTTDFTLFAYLADVFVIESKRGKGYASILLDAIFTHPDLKDIQKWMLATSDAHGLYKKFGFRPLVMPEKMMERFIK